MPYHLGMAVGPVGAGTSGSHTYWVRVRVQKYTRGSAPTRTRTVMGAGMGVDLDPWVIHGPRNFQQLGGLAGPAAHLNK